MNKSKFTRAFTLFFIVTTLMSCGGRNSVNCDSAISISSYVIGLRQGLGDVSQNEYSQFRIDTLDVYDTVSAFVDEKDVSVAAVALQQDLADFIRFLDDAQWDVSKLADSTIAVLLVKKLSNSEALARSNEIELALIGECGVASTVPTSQDSQSQLPDVSFPPVDQTDPPANRTSDEKEAIENGRMVATLFGLTLSESEVQCLGEALSGIYDITSSAADIGQYQSQFQKAFDTCSIAFNVPSN